MNNRIIALLVLALAGCAGTTDEATTEKPGETGVAGDEAVIEPPSATWDARDPGLAPPDDPALPF